MKLSHLDRSKVTSKLVQNEREREMICRREQINCEVYLAQSDCVCVLKWKYSLSHGFKVTAAQKGPQRRDL